MVKIGLAEFFKAAQKYTVVDVRSPKEYDAGHIPGAVNIPVLNNDERAQIGTIYKQKGRESAIEKGLELVTPKSAAMTTEARLHTIDNELLLYCWRGGLRSQRMAGLFESAGMKVRLLDGGYKTYRTKAMETFGKLDKIMLLRGSSGCGKTAILHELEKMGEQILDLEAVAKHRGSAFGGLGQEIQPATKHFQNLLFEKLRLLDLNLRIWIESESLTIGRVYLPEPLWKAMNQAKILELTMDKKWRVERLVKEYGQFDQADLARCISGIKRKFGGNRVREAIDFLAAGNLAAVAEMLLDYYDKMYDHSREKYKERDSIFVKCADGNAERNASLLLEAVDKTHGLVDLEA